MDIEECFRRSFIRKTTVDSGLIRSLIKMSAVKEKAVRTATTEEETISAYVSLAYDALREVLEAICVSIGYKVLSHVCIGELLKREIESFDYASFDRMRYIRNGINYYGEDVEFKQGKEIIEKIFAMKQSLLEKHLKKFVEERK